MKTANASTNILWSVANRFISALQSVRYSPEGVLACVFSVCWDTRRWQFAVLSVRSKNTFDKFSSFRVGIRFNGLEENQSTFYRIIQIKMQYVVG